MDPARKAINIAKSKRVAGRAQFINDRNWPDKRLLGRTNSRQNRISRLLIDDKSLRGVTIGSGKSWRSVNTSDGTGLDESCKSMTIYANWPSN